MVPLRRALLGGTALCSAAVLMMTGQARAAGMPTQGAVDLSAAGPNSINTKILSGGLVTPSTAPTSSTGTVATVDVSANARTLIDWNTFTVSSGNTLNFNFNQASDIVINKVVGGAGITVDGAVNGKIGGGATTGGNIWFLADQGVFIHGTVTASGVFASNNTATLSDSDLLSDSLATIKTALVTAGSSLIDLEGSAVASSVSVNADGSITLGASTTQATSVSFDSEGPSAVISLGGNVNASSTGAIDLTSAGAISQTAGALTASTLSASSVGGMDLSKANQVATVTSLTNTGSGDVSYNSARASGVTVSSVTNHVGDTTLTSSSGDIGIGSGGVDNNSSGLIDIESAGALTLTGNLSSSSATLVANGGGISQTGGAISAASLSATANGDLSLTGANLVPTVDSLKAIGLTGDITYNSAETSTTTTVNTATSVGGGVSITAGGELDLPTDTALHLISAATDLTLSAGAALDIGDATKVSVGRDLSLTGTSFPDATLSVAATRDYTLHDTAASGGLTLGTVSAPRNVSVTVDHGDLVITSLTGTAGSATALASSGAADVTTASAGTTLSITGTTASLGTGTAAGDLTVTGTGGDVDVTTQAKSTGGSVILSADGEVNVSGGAAISANVDYSATGHSFSSAALSGFTIGRDLTIHDTDSTNGVTVGTVVAPRNASITADHGNVTVTSVTGTSGSVTVLASSGAADVTTASAGTTLSITGATASLGTGTAAGDLTLTGTGGDVDVTTQAKSTGGSVILSADGEVNVSGGAAISASLDYSATGHSFSSAALSGFTIGRDLTIHDTDSTNGVTVGTVVAPRNASITADHGGVTVTSITATSGDATVTASAGNATVTTAVADSGDVQVTGSSASLGTGTAGGDITVTGHSGDATVGAKATAGGDVTVQSTDSSSGNAVLRDVQLTGTTDHTVAVASAGGSATFGANAGSAGAGSLTGVSGHTTTVNMSSSGTSAGDVTVNLAGVSNAAFGTLSAPKGGVSVTSGSGDVSVASATAGDGSIGVFATTGAASLTTGTATGGHLTLSGDTASLGSGTADNDVTVTGTAGDIAVTTLAKSNSGSVILSADGAVNVSGGATVSANLDYSVTGHSFSSAALTGPTAGRDFIIHDTNATTGLSLGTVSATRNASVTADNGNVTVTSITGTNGDATVTAANGSVTVTGASAGGDVTVHETGTTTGDAILRGVTLTGSGDHTVTVSSAGGAATLGADAGSPGAGDVTGVSGHTTVINMSASGTNSGDVTINLDGITNAGVGTLSAPKGKVSATVNNGTITVATATAGAGDLSISGASASLGAGTSSGDVAVHATGSTSGDAVLRGVTLTGTGNHAVDVSSTGGSVTLGADAGDPAAGNVTGVSGHVTTIDLTASATHPGDVTVNVASITDAVFGTISTLDGSISVTTGSGDASVTLATAANAIDISATTGTASVTTATATTGHIVISGATASLGTGTAGGDLTVTGTSGDATVTTKATAGGDVTVQATGTSSGDAVLRDVQLTGTSNHTVTVASAGGSAALGADAGSSPAGSVTGVAGHTTTVNVSTTADPTDVVVNLASVSNANLGTLSAADGNVSVTIGSGDVTIGSASAGGGDIAINMQGGSVTLGSATAGDDVVIRATGDVTATGAIESGQKIGTIDAADTGSGGPGDVLAAALPMTIFGASATDQTGGFNVNIKALHVASSATIEAGTSGDVSTTGAGSQALIVATGADAGGVSALSLADVSANQDIGLEVTNATGSISAGALTAGRDVAVHSTSSTIGLTSAAAGDDVVLRAPSGQITVTGGLTSGQTQRGEGFDDTTGLGDTLASALPITIFGSTGTALTSLSGHDIDVVSTQVSVTGTVEAGTASASGDLTAQHGSDVRIVATGADAGGSALSLADVKANQDIGLDATNAGGSITVGALTAGRDVAARSATTLDLTSAAAGDDVALRATAGQITVTDTLSSGTAQRGEPFDDTAGLGDQLASASPMTVFGEMVNSLTGGHDVNVVGLQVSAGAITAGGTVPASGDPDHAAQLGSDAAIVALGADVGGGHAISLSTVNANHDIGLDADHTGASISTAALTAGGDVAARTLNGNITLPSAAAGDDIVIVSGADLTVSGTLASGHTQNGVSPADTSGLGDQLVTANPITIFAATPDVSAGHSINITAAHIDVTGATEAGTSGDTSTAGPGSHVVAVAIGADSGGSALTMGDVSANGDIGLETTSATGSISAANLIAGRDVAVHSIHSTIALTSAAAGDDVVLRAPSGQITVTGTLGSGVAQRGEAFDDANTALGDQLAAQDAIQIFGQGLAPVTGGHDVNVAGLQVSAGAITAGGTVPVSSDPDYANQLGSDAAIVALGSDAGAAGGHAISLSTVNANHDIGLDADQSGASISTAALTAGGDVAARTLDGDITVPSAAAGDDIVIVAGTDLTVSGTLTSGHTENGVSPADTSGYGDDLVASNPITLFGGAAPDVSGGHSINITAAHIAVTGATEAGTSGDTSTAGAGSHVVAVATGADSGISALSMGDVSANQDIGLDAPGGGSVTAGALTAGRDVAVHSTSSTIDLTSAAAGDDVVLRALSGPITVAAGLTSGQAQRGEGFDDTTGLGDTLATGLPMTIFGSTGTSLTSLSGHDVDVVSTQVSVTGTVEAGTASASSDLTGQHGSDVRIVATGADGGGSALSLADVKANQDIGLDATDAAGSITVGALTAGRDVAAQSATTLNLDSAAAGDDVVLRATTGQITVTDTLSSGTAQRGEPFDDTAGLGDRLALSSPMTIFNQPVSSVSGGHDVNVVGLQVSAGAITAGGTVPVSSDPDYANQLGSDAAIVALGADVGGGHAISLSTVNANHDIGLDADHTGASISTAALTAGGDVAARTFDGDITVPSAAAGDDIVIVAGADLTVSGTLTSGHTENGVSPADTSGYGDDLVTSNPITIFAATPDVSGGHSINITAAHIDVTGATEAGTSGDTSTAGAGSHVVAVATGADGGGVSALTLADVSANQDIALETTSGTGSISAANLTAGRDLAVHSTHSTIALTSAAAGDDVVLRAPSGQITVTGTLGSGVAQRGEAFDDGATGLGDQLASQDTIKIFGLGLTDVTGGHDVNVAGLQVSAGAITAGGTIPVSSDPDYTDQVGSSARIVAVGSDAGAAGGHALSLSDVSANQDVGLDADAGSASVSAGTLTAGRDVAVRSGASTIHLTSAAAGDDVVLRAPSGQITVTGTLASGVAQRGAPFDDASAGLGDVLAGLDATQIFGQGLTDVTGGHDVNVVGLQVSAGAITAGGTIPVSSDPDYADQVGSSARIVALGSDAGAAGGHALSLSDVSANQDVGLDADAGSASVSAGAVIAGRDVAVRSASGAIDLTSAAAGDDVVLRAPLGQITVTGTLASGTAQQGAPFDDSTGLGDTLAGQDAIQIFGQGLAPVTGGHDVNVAGLQVSAGAITAGGTVPASADPDYANQLGSDAAIVALGSDASAVGGHAISLSTVNANHDIGLDADHTGASISTAALTAGGDVAARTLDGNITVPSAAAGDDIVIVAGADLTVSGTLTSGHTENGVSPADTSGYGDDLVTSNPITIFAATPDVSGAHSINITAAHIDVTGATEAGTSGDTSTAGAGSHVVAVATGADSGGSALSMADVSANQDIGLETTGATGSISAGALIAGRDVAVHSSSSTIDLTSAAAGDDVVLRAPSGQITVTGTLGSGVAQRGEAFDDGATGLGDQLAGQDAIQIFGQGLTDVTGGHDVNVVGAQVTAGSITAGGTIPAGSDPDYAAQIGSSVRVVSLGTDAGATGGHAISLVDVNANQDIGLDAQGGGSVSATVLTAGRDVAVRSTSSTIDLTSVAAGDDVVLRAPSGQITVTGTLASGTAQLGAPLDDNSAGLGDKLAGQDLVQIFGQGLTDVTGGHDINFVGAQVTAGSITAGGTIPVSSDPDYTAQVGSSVRVVSLGTDAGATGGHAISLVDVNANQDIGLDAQGGGSVSATILTAGRDAAVRSTSSTIDLTSVAASDDVVLRAPSGQITVTGTLASGTAQLGAPFDDGSTGLADQLASQDSIQIFGQGLAPVTGGHDVNVAGLQVSAGAITAGGTLPASADPDYANQLGSNAAIVALGSDAGAAGGHALSLTDVSANQDVGLDADASGASISANALVAGRDVAARTFDGDITLSSAAAGDDIALRAGGDLTIDNGLTSGQTQLGVPLSDGAGLADQLVSVAHMSIFGGSVSSLAGGYDINAVGAHILVKGATEAGTNGDTSTAGAGSQALFAATGADSGTPALQFQDGANLPQTVTANQDIGLQSAGSILAGALTAGRDVAAQALGGTLTTGRSGFTDGAIAAGDDVLLRAPSGRVTINGDVNTGVAQRGEAFDDTSGRGDQLASATSMTIFGAVSPALTGHDIDIDAAQVSVTGTIEAGTASAASDVSAQQGSDVRIVATGADGGGSAISLADVKANQDIGLDSTNVSGSISVNDLTAGRDVAARSAGALGLNSAVAGDDIVLRATAGQITVADTLTSGVAQRGEPFDDSNTGLGDILGGQDAGSIKIFGQGLTDVTGGHDINVVGGHVSAGSITAGGTIPISSDPDYADQVGSSVRVVSLGTDAGATGGHAISLVDVNANQDVGLDAQGGGSVSATVLTAGRDVAVRSTSSTIDLTSVSAGDDVVLRAPSGQITVTGTLASGTAQLGAPFDDSATGLGDKLAGQDIVQIFGQGLTDVTGGHDVNVVGAQVTAGSITAGGTIPVSSDPDYADRVGSSVRVVSLGTDAGAAGGHAISLVDVNANQDVGLDAHAGGSLSATTLTAGRDAAVRSTSSTIHLTSIAAGDDVVLRAPSGQITVTGTLASGTAQLAAPFDDSSAGLGDKLAGQDLVQIFGQGLTDVTGGHDVNVAGLQVTAGSITAGGTIPVSSDPDYTDQVGSSVRVVSLGTDAGAAGGHAISLVDINANQDIGLDAQAGGSVSATVLTAGRDAAVRSTSSTIHLNSVAAGDDVVLRSPSGQITVTGSVASGVAQRSAPFDDISGLGDQLAGQDAGSTKIFGEALNTVTGGHDINVVGAQVTAGSITAGGTIPASSDPDYAAQIGSSVRVVSLGADAGAAGGHAISLVDVNANQDIGLDAQGGGSVSATTLTAGRDAAVRSTTSTIGLTSVAAGDDVVLRAESGQITVNGTLTSGVAQRGAPFHDTAGLGDQLASSAVEPMTIFGATNATVTSLTGGHDIDIVGGQVKVTDAINAGGLSPSSSNSYQLGSDVRIVALGADPVSGSAIDLQTVGADGSIGLDATTGAISTLALTAGSDVAARSNNETIGVTSIDAGDDIVLRAPSGQITVTGALTSGVAQRGETAAADTSGLGDQLATQDAIEIFGQGLTDVTGGHDINVVGAEVTAGSITAGGTIPVSSDPDYTAQVGSSVRVVSLGTDAGATGGHAISLVDINANQDIGLDAQGGGSVSATILTAGRDAAVRSTSSTVDLTSVAAGDDVVLRAPTGQITVTGTLTSGHTQLTAPFDDSAGLGDQLASSGVSPMTIFGTSNSALTSLAGGHDIDIVGGQVKVGAAIEAGTASAVTDVTSQRGSDVRIVALGADPVSGSAIDLQTVDANQDVALDATHASGSIATAALTAGRDLAVRSSSSAITLPSAAAGDDIVLRAPSGQITVNGTLTSGQAQRGEPFRDSTGLGDQLASSGVSPMTIFGTSNSSFTALTGGHDVDIVGGQVAVTGVIDAGNASPSPSNSYQLGSDVRIVALGANPTSGKSIALSDVNADGSIGLDAQASTAGDIQTGALSAGADVAVESLKGDVQIPTIAAGDDIAIRAGGSVTIATTMTTGHAVRGVAVSDAAGLADQLATFKPMTVSGTTFTLGGEDIDVIAGTINLDGQATAYGAGSDVRLQAGGAINVVGVRADEDILIDGSTATAGDVTATGLLSAGRDIGVRSRTGAVSLASAQAVDDLVLRASGNIGVSGTLTTTGPDNTASPLTNHAGQILLNADPTTLSTNFDLAGSNIDVKSDGGAISVSGATSAATDARFQTAKAGGGAVTVAAVTAGRDILVDGTSATATGALQATGGDIAARGRTGSVSLTTATASDDIAIRAATAVNAATLTSGTGADGYGVADRLIDPSENGPMTVSGTSFALTGNDIDVVSGGTIGLTGQASANGPGSDVRLQAAGAINVVGLTADEDLLIDGSTSGSGDVTVTGSLVAARDIGVRADHGGVSLASAQAGDDLVLRASGNIGVSGTLTTQGHDSSATGQAGEILLAADPTTLKVDFDLTGSNVDVKSDGGAISVSGATSAATDARFQTAKAGGGAVTVAAVTAGRDILVDGTSATATGALQATGGDIAARGRTGSVSLTTATASDDIAIRAATAVNAATLTSGTGADGYGVADGLIDPSENGPMTVSGTSFALTGNDIDVVSGGTIGLTGHASANGPGSDVRLQAAGAINVVGLTADEDLLIDGSTSGSGDVTATGALVAARDIGVRANGGAISLASAQAGDDLVLRASGNIGVSGTLVTTGSDSSASGQAGEILLGADPSVLKSNFSLSGSDIDVRSDGGSIAMSGAATAATDARFQTAKTTGGSVTLASVTAGQDILADGTSVTTAALQAGRDIAARSRTGSVTLSTGSAGDDIAIRAATTVSAGALTSGTGGDGAGVADSLIDASENGPMKAVGLTFGLSGGGSVDVVSTGAINVTGAVKTTGSGSDARFLSQGAATLANVTAGRDVLVDGASVQTTALLTSGRDVAVLAANGAALVASASAGDNIAIAATGNVSAGPLSGGSADGGGVADALMASGQPGAITGALNPYAAPAVLAPTAGDVQVVSSGGDIALTGAASGGSIRLASSGNVSTAPLNASNDIVVRANSLTDPTQAWTAKSIQLESTNPAGVALGTSPPVASGATPLTLSNNGFGELQAGTVTLYAGSTGATTHPTSILIGGLQVNDSVVHTLNLYAGSGGAVKITGVFAPASTNAATSTVLVIGAAPQPAGPTSPTTSLAGTLVSSNDWAPGVIKVIRDPTGSTSGNGGSIGSAPGQGLSFPSGIHAFGSVELNSTGDILMGTNDFITGLGSKTGSQIDSYAEATGVLPPSGVLLAAGSITFRANGRIVQQNTSTSGTAFTGMLLTGDGVTQSNPTTAYAIGSVGAQGSFTVRLGRLDGKTTITNPGLPDSVELFLSLKDGAAIVTNTQVSVSPRFGFYPGTGPSQFYRVNSCVIGQAGNCNPLSNTIINIQPDQLLQGIQLDQTDQPDVEDVTITGAANEEIWRRPE